AGSSDWAKAGMPRTPSRATVSSVFFNWLSSLAGARASLADRAGGVGFGRANFLHLAALGDDGPYALRRADILPAVDRHALFLDDRRADHVADRASDHGASDKLRRAEGKGASLGTHS